MIEIYDSTLRDGGYINNWKFTDAKINGIYKAGNNSGIRYSEVGYLDMINPSIVKKDTSRIIVMIDYNKRDKYEILNRDETNIDGIRVACHKPEINDCIEYTRNLKDKGYLTSIQMMAISNYSESDIIDIRDKFNGVDIISLADSNGSLFPKDIAKLGYLFKRNRESYLLAIHPHNNLQLAFANGIQAIDSGFDIIDCSFNGIGRGAGNLPTELIMIYLNKFREYDFNIKPILEAIDKYILPLRGAYNWGYNIPNLFSGIERIHPYYGRDSSKYNLNDAYEIIAKKGIEKPIKYNWKKKIICVIPARYESSRFLGKPLEMINGKPLIKWVYDNASQIKLFDRVLVATDDYRISNKCDELEIDCAMTSSDCETGTDRIAEVAETFNADLYVNVQGDEPLIISSTIQEFIDNILKLGEIDRMAFNSMTECVDDDLENPNVPKVVTNVYGDLLYISRLPIPCKKSKFEPKYYKELGLHAYTKKGLAYFAQQEQLESEMTENIEFLRFLENGKQVRMIYLKLPFKNHAADIPSDIQVIEDIMRKHAHQFR